jgi:dienelactone hydrolase
MDRHRMSVRIHAPGGSIPTYVATPDGQGPWPGGVVVHDARHSFLNDHDPSDVPAWAVVAGALSRSGYHEPSAQDARRRITAFFEAHLIANADEPAPHEG